jgi:(E)-4-hydroxy-3-methylbut-2-enyl-diphosphate synthase
MNNKNLTYKYCNSLTEYKRRETIEVKIGDVPMGGKNPIRVQSMTTIDTMDTLGSVEQSIRMIEAGCEYVRITAPSLKEAQNLEEIKKELRRRGYKTPLVADIHFTPNAAELAARIVEKVRVNPGNYADKKKFENIEYTDASYAAELERIREKFTPLVKICKEYGTAMRIGTNHGSLSDRILSRYGDTPLGMVESALEFIRICEDLNYYNLVVSMKASNTQVMVQAYRLLVEKLDTECLKPYPLHLGVTEAGEGEDGRIKSAVGIGTLLEDGLGDTVRVSLTEDPEFEIPVAKALVDRYNSRLNHREIPNLKSQISNLFSPYEYKRRETQEITNIGHSNVPRVVADFSKFNIEKETDLKCIGYHYSALFDKWSSSDQAADYIYLGSQKVPFMFPNGLRAIQNHTEWTTGEDKTHVYPYFENFNQFSKSEKHPELNFVKCTLSDLTPDTIQTLKNSNNVVLMLETDNLHAMPEMRRAYFEFLVNGIKTPVFNVRSFENISEDALQLYSATDLGGLLVDGFGDGVMLSTEKLELDRQKLSDTLANYNKTSFGILQAARTRMSKTEYISCPSCGRTLFDLQETTAMIRKRTDHLKGVKIGIMGCIVNGPGEMADADYGYVGVGVGKIALYRGQNVVKKSVPSDNAVDELIELIKEDGRWIEANVDAITI